MVDGARRRTGVAEEAIEWNEVLCGGALVLKVSWSTFSLPVVCVECLFFKDTGVQPHLSVGLISVRQGHGLLGLKS